LAGKHRINEYVRDNLKAGLAVGSNKRLKLVANLPYNIATPIILNLLVDDELSPSLIVVTIQKELADRMMAKPQSSSYGALSVLVQMLGDVELVRVLGPKVFWPRPKVDSAIIKIIPSKEKRSEIPDLKWFQYVVRDLFTLRRKNLRGVLYSRWRKHWTGKPDVDAFLEELGLVGEVRAEAMNGPELLALAEALKTRLGVSKIDEAEEEVENDDAEVSRN
jgi:16S rRNA (adenine1518-N6/adenine1519-N6)-dimethyltransferase